MNDSLIRCGERVIALLPALLGLPGLPGPCAPVVDPAVGGFIVWRGENMALTWHRRCTPVAVTLAGWREESMTGHVTGRVHLSADTYNYTYVL